MLNTIQYYEQDIVFGGALGVSPNRVNSYLQEQGYNTTMTYFPGSVDNVTSVGDVVILEYFNHKTNIFEGMHYVAVEKVGAKDYTVYNGFSGEEFSRTFDSIDAWVSRNDFRPYALISIQ